MRVFVCVFVCLCVWGGGRRYGTPGPGEYITPGGGGGLSTTLGGVNPTVAAPPKWRIHGTDRLVCVCVCVCVSV